MPNHISNILTIHGTDAEVREVRALLAGRREKEVADVPTGEFEDLLVDFEKLVPMPPSLRIISGNLVAFLDNQFTATRPVKELIAEIKKRSEEDIAVFCAAVLNLKRHGHASWYTWSIANWGTKWNAYDQKEVEPGVLYFETAWNSPAAIFQVLSLKFPGLVFEVKYADEDYGSNLGHYSLKGGKRTEIETFEGKPERALEFAYAVKGTTPDDEVEA